MIVASPNSQRLVQQQIARHKIRPRQTIESQRITRYAHTRLYHHEGAERCQKTVRIDILIRVHRLLLQALSMQDRQRRVHICKEELYAIFDHVARQEAGRGRERRTTWRTGDAVEAISDLGRERGLSLRLPQFADHLCSGPLGPLLLWYRVVGAG